MKIRSGDEAHCTYCDYIGRVYGLPHSAGKGYEAGVSAPFCPQCKRNNKLLVLVHKPLVSLDDFIRFLNGWGLTRMHVYAMEGGSRVEISLDYYWVRVRKLRKEIEARKGATVMVVLKKLGFWEWLLGLNRERS